MSESDIQDLSFLETPFETIDGELDNKYLFGSRGCKVPPVFISAFNIGPREANTLERLRGLYTVLYQFKGWTLQNELIGFITRHV
jgi:hypothetical protein